MNLRKKSDVHHLTTKKPLMKKVFQMLYKFACTDSKEIQVGISSTKRYTYEPPEF